MGIVKFSESLKCELNEIGRLITALEAFGEENSIADGPLQQVLLVLDELLTNVMSYGFPDSRKPVIKVSVGLEGDILHILLEDNGIAFDPLVEAAVPDIDADIDDRDIGGLGIHIAKTMMDDISYQRVGDKNQLRFHKNLG